MEAAGITGPAAPGRRWQVPKSFVTGASPRRRILVWGALLGPGFATRNPFAGFTALPIAVAAFGNLRVGSLVALGVGVAHATARALAMLRDAQTADEMDYMRSVLRSMYWRKYDGVA
jgi:hypothetical protein